MIKFANKSVVDLCYGSPTLQRPFKFILEFSLNGFTEFSELGDKNICRYSKTIWTCNLMFEIRMLSERQQDTSERQDF